MADLIDRDALMKKICGNECGDVCDKECENSWCNFYDYIMDAPAVNRWIPCSERLPEEIGGESEEVLAIVEHRDLTGMVWSKNYEIVWRERNEWSCRGKVTHWMPLPDPPEGGAENA